MEEVNGMAMERVQEKRVPQGWVKTPEEMKIGECVCTEKGVVGRR